MRRVHDEAWIENEEDKLGTKLGTLCSRGNLIDITHGDSYNAVVLS